MPQPLSDREILDDLLASQKHIGTLYNTFASECKNAALESDMMNILREEHNLQSAVFTEMEKRGWYSPEPARQLQIEETKVKFQNAGNSL